MGSVGSLPKRNEVPEEQTWDLKSVFATPELWDEACKYVSDRLTEISGFRGTIHQGPARLREFLHQYTELAVLMGKINVYAYDDYAVDTSNQKAAARSGQSSSLRAGFQAATSFFEPELLEIGFETIHQWLDENPDLVYLKFYLDHLEEHKRHLRSAEVEEVLALTGDPFSGAYGAFNALTAADMKFEKAISSSGETVELGQASIGSLITNVDRDLRRTAWEHYADGYLGLKNTFAVNLTTAVKQDVLISHVRNYSSALEASLHENDIEVDVFHNLISVFKKHLPTWHRYWGIRKRALGYDKFHVYDIKAPLTAAKPVVPFDQAVEWICEGMQPLGDEYVSALRKGCLEERWVDRARNKGKREGAFSSGSYGTHPFIMMSYADDLFSLSTLAHELGHSMHSYYTRKTQPYIYSHYGLFVAEVASNFNQAMVRNYLFNTQTHPDFQIALIEEAMSNFHRYFFIMPTLARFEFDMHTRVEKGLPLSADILIQRMADLFKEGYGEEVEFDKERIGITWAQFQHMYMNFYVYQYATGISGAQALVSGILDGKPNSVDNYLSFLKAGGSMKPLDALKLAGVELAKTEPVERSFAMLAEIVDRLDRLV